MIVIVMFMTMMMIVIVLLMIFISSPLAGHSYHGLRFFTASAGITHICKFKN
jgi:hypothetical protein